MGCSALLRAVGAEGGAQFSAPLLAVWGAGMCVEVEGEGWGLSCCSSLVAGLSLGADVSGLVEGSVVLLFSGAEEVCVTHFAQLFSEAFIVLCELPHGFS